MIPSNSTQKIVIDRRPLWIVFMDRFRRTILVALMFVLFFIFLGKEAPHGLSEDGYKVLCLFFLCVSLWSTNVIPLSATSLLAIGALPLMGVMDASQVYSFFGNKAVFFILGAFILSGAMIACGLSSRMSLYVLQRWGHRPKLLMRSIYLLGAVSSCFMSEHAVAAMLFPIVTEIVNSLGLPRRNSAFAKGLYFSMAWGCIIGGSTTVLGGGRVPLAVEILEKGTEFQSSIGILQYSALSLPLVILLLCCGWGILSLFFQPEKVNMSPALENLKKKSLSLGKMTFQEMGTGLAMMVTLFFWFVFGDQLGIANISIIAIVTLFVFSLITWKEVEPHVNWAIILMYGGAICLGEVMAKSGAAQWLANQVFDGLINSPTLFLITIAALSTLFTTFMSNSAVIAVLLPPVLSMCAVNNINPVLATMTVILPSNFAFILPIATPASALAYSSRQISLREMATVGMLLSLLGLGCYIFLLKVYWPLLDFQ